MRGASSGLSKIKNAGHDRIHGHAGGQGILLVRNPPGQGKTAARAGLRIAGARPLGISSARLLFGSGFRLGQHFFRIGQFFRGWFSLILGLRQQLLAGRQTNLARLQNGQLPLQIDGSGCQLFPFRRFLLAGVLQLLNLRDVLQVRLFAGGDLSVQFR